MTNEELVELLAAERRRVLADQRFDLLRLRARIVASVGRDGASQNDGLKLALMRLDEYMESRKT